MQDMGYHLYFQFTINSENRILEPNLPGLDQRLKQLQQLCDQFGPRAVNWRFDPICFYRSKDESLRNNLDDTHRIAAAAAAAGLLRCTTSVMDPYAKIKRRTARLQGFALVDPPGEDKIRALLELEHRLAAHRIRVFTCCESELLRALPAHSSIQAAACIPSELLMEIYGGTLSLKPDGGQRVKSGCGCRVSVDIGSYEGHRCSHGCLYCYASPAEQKPEA
jgi:DNA repair photolyase